MLEEEEPVEGDTKEGGDNGGRSQGVTTNMAIRTKAHGGTKERRSQNRPSRVTAKRKPRQSRGDVDSG